MNSIRKATTADLARIAEIEIFNYRLNFYPIFKNDWYYFDYLTVPSLIEKYKYKTDNFYVYDDGVVKGFVYIEDTEIKKLFVEPVLQGKTIGSKLLQYAISRGADYLWALEKNVRAIKFYNRHGFTATGNKMYEEYTSELLIRLKFEQ